MTTTHRAGGVPIVAASIAVFAWGFGPLFVKGIDASAETIVFFRVVVAIPIAVAVAYLTGGRITFRLVRIAFPTAVCFALSIITGFSSFRQTSIVDATLIPALQPALVLFAAVPLFGERRARSEVTWAVVAFAGVAVVVAGASGAHESLGGDLLAVANLLVFTGYFLLAKRIRRDDVHAWALLASVFIGTAVIVVPWAALASPDLGAIHGADWFLLVGLVLLPGMVGHGLMTWAHHYVDVSITSMLTLANPVVSIVGAWLLFSQTLAALQIVGAVVVLISLGAIVRRQRAGRALAAEAALGGDLLDE
ncbi:MAG TPA: DMT family transporter [Acidimicrobiia bacterium]|nr:DMT family transporter [Acidimicrobiia bacterium]